MSAHITPGFKPAKKKLVKSLMKLKGKTELYVLNVVVIKITK